MAYQIKTSMEFENALLDLAKVDDKVGNAANIMAIQARISDLQNQILELKQEKEDLDVEFRKVAKELHHIFYSMRYRVGNFLIRPIEIVLRKK